MGAGFFGGLLGGLGEGMLERRQRQDRLKDMAVQGSLKQLAGLADDPRFTDDPHAREDITQAYLGVLRDYAGMGEKTKAGGLAGKLGKKKSEDPFAHAQQAITTIMGKVYGGGEAKPATPPSTMQSSVAPIPGVPAAEVKVPGSEGRAETRGPLLRDDEIADRQARIAAKKAEIAAVQARKQHMLLEQDDFEQKLDEARRLGLSPGTDEYKDFVAGRSLKPTERREAEPKLMELRGPNGEKVTGLYSPESGPMTIAKRPLPGYTPVIKDPEAAGGGVAEQNRQDAIAAYKEKHGIKGELTAIQRQAAIAEQKVAEEPSDVKAQRALTTALAEERLQKAREDRSTTPKDIAPGSREYKVAQDLATGKLTFPEFRSLISYSRDVNKKLDIYDAAAKINPGFNPAQFEMGFRFASNPQVQRQLASIDNLMRVPDASGKTAVESLLDLSDKASRTGATVLNKAIIKGGFMLGGKRYTDLATARTAFADELSLALGVGNATDMARQMGFDMTDPNLSPENFRSAVQGIVVPFMERRKASILEQMGVYGQPGMNPAAGPANAPLPPVAGGNDTVKRLLDKYK